MDTIKIDKKKPSPETETISKVKKENKINPNKNEAVTSVTDGAQISSKRRRNRKKKSAKKVDQESSNIDISNISQSKFDSNNHDSLSLRNYKLINQLEIRLENKQVLSTEEQIKPASEKATVIDQVNQQLKSVPVETTNLEKPSNINNKKDENTSDSINAQSSNMDNKRSEKSREDIKAERQSKKNAKQAAKLKKPDVDMINDKMAKLTTATKTDVKVIESNSTVNATISANVSPVDLKNKANVTVIKENTPEIKTTNLDPKPIEKSRDDIKAEREAKKLAKQQLKNKNKVDINVEEIPKASIATQIKTPSSGTPSIPAPLLEKSSDGIAQEKSKAELRAERRAKQEAQRAAKEQTQVTKKIPENPDKLKPPQTAPPKPEIKKSSTPEKSTIKQNDHKVKLFNHLYNKEALPKIPLNSKIIHPSIVRLGIQYASHTVVGSNARCIALLNTLKQVIKDYSLPANVEFSRGFEAYLGPCVKYLNSCRPLAVSMNNALKHIKLQLTQLPNNISENDAKIRLHDEIDTYIINQIKVAGTTISMMVSEKIVDNDVILTYGCSSLIEHILIEASSKKKFRVVVVEAHPWNEGQEMLRRLTANNIKCSMVMISALSFVMREINKVFLGAGALLANGYVMARAGTAQVAMVANAHNVPVLVCCETYKFSERVQTDSFVYNEIGDPDDLVKCDSLNSINPLLNWRDFDTLTPLNLTYDVTPPDLVTAVVTERAIIPCTSVPVILRIIPEA